MSQFNEIKKAEKLLNKFSLKKTKLRLNLLELFLEKNCSLSQAEILEKLQNQHGSVDRVSVYRNLSQFKLLGIIHEVENNKYVSCAHDCKKHAHLLLYCQFCEQHKEIKNHELISQFFKAINEFNFLSNQKSVFIKGVCQNCLN